jgi:uncharacterized protein (TIGR01777 family)
MRVAITGASGLIGGALRTRLTARGDDVLTVGRGVDAEIVWDPASGGLDGTALDGVDAVVHLSGEGIGERRWTPEQKAAILDSRVQGTDLLARTLAGMPTPPSVLVSGSAIGWYGDRGDERLTEHSAPPATPGFLSRVCVAWEAATGPAEAAGIRTVHARTGIVLTPDGGALARMLLPFRLGLGGRIGSGRQYMSWISLADEVGALVHAIDTPAIVGPLNLTAPNPVANATFTEALGTALHRPTVLPTPLLPLKLRYGAELVESLLVEGQRVLPAALEAGGYEFRDPELAGALASML